MGVAEAIAHWLRTATTSADSVLRWRGEHTLTAFLGTCEKGPFNSPTLVQDASQFEITFGWSSDSLMGPSIAGFFANGGTECLVVRLEDWDVTAALDALDRVDDVSLVCAPDLVRCGDLSLLNNLQVSIVLACELAQDRFALLDCPAGLTVTQMKEWRQNVWGVDTARAALYYPWLHAEDPVYGRTVTVPPSGHVAGVMARFDATLGFHHGPGNETVRGAYGPELSLTAMEMQHLFPIGINPIIRSPSRGPVLWGARTLSSDPGWRFIRRARLLAYLTRTIRRETSGFVLQRVESATPGRVASEVAGLLEMLWRGGALAGETAQEAYAVGYSDDVVDSEFQLLCVVGVDPELTAQLRIRYVTE